MLLAMDASAFEAGGGVSITGGGRNPVTTTTTTTVGGFTVTDYTPSMTAYYRYESGALTTNDPGTIAGASCNTTGFGDPTADTTAGQYTQGAAAVDLDGTGDYHETSCTNLDFTGAFTIGGTFRQDAAGVNDHWISTGAQGSANGFTLRMGSGDRINCWVGDGTDNVQANEPSGQDISGNVAYVMCSHDGTNTINVYKWYNDQSETTWSASQGTPAAETTNPHQFGANGSGGGEVDGRMDEIWLLPVNLTAAQRCRIVSCGVEGDQAAGGLCLASSATAYSDTGRNDQTCVASSCSVDGWACGTNADCISGNGCTLPDSEAAAP